jgi:hypothetical protein
MKRQCLIVSAIALLSINAVQAQEGSVTPFPLLAALTAPLTQQQKPISITTDPIIATPAAIQASIDKARRLQVDEVCSAIAAEFYGDTPTCKSGRIRDANRIIEVQRSEAGRASFNVTIAGPSPKISAAFGQNTNERIDLIAEVMIDLDGNVRIVTSVETSVQNNVDINTIYTADERPFSATQRRAVKTAVYRVSAQLSRLIGLS